MKKFDIILRSKVKVPLEIFEIIVEQIVEILWEVIENILWEVM